MPSFDTEIFNALVDQVESAVSTSGGLSNLSNWICSNTSDPVQPGKRFSFKGHEYQKQICNDTHPIVDVRKATQVGMSELSVRMLLALLAKLPNTKGIYVLPSQRFSTKFVSSRVSPVIENSERLKAMLNRNTDSTELKQIGNSFVFFAGASNDSMAISIPAKFLIIDELAFCRQNVLSVFTSRLGHQKEADRVIRRFSSPLHPRSDISALYEKGTQNIYMVWHERCGQWTDLHPAEHLVLPGFDNAIIELSPQELRQLEHRIPEAFFKCPHCGDPVTTQNLANPAYRAWVPRYPERETASYDVNPTCLAEIRTPQALLKDLLLYKNNVRWQQFSLGTPAESSAEMITASALERCFSVSQSMASQMSYGSVGVDVGKVSHVVVGRKVDGVFHVGQMFTVAQDEENALGNTVVETQRKYLCQQVVIDSAPDVTIVKHVQGRLPLGMVWGSYFVSGKGKRDLNLFECKKDEGVVSVARTRALDEFVSEFNQGKIRLPIGMPNENEIRAHLTNLKRIVSFDTTGEEKAIWSSSGDDHYLFALFYAWLGSVMIDEGSVGWGFGAGMGVGDLVRKVRMRAA